MSSGNMYDMAAPYLATLYCTVTWWVPIHTTSICRRLEAYCPLVLVVIHATSVAILLSGLGKSQTDNY